MRHQADTLNVAPNLTPNMVDPELLMFVESLELRARGIVSGFLQGLHRSPYVGWSTDFASHREYVPGDDPRRVNWKIYARNHRLYVKEYDAETNLRLWLLVDISHSMACGTSGVSKHHYAMTLAAALAHLALRQRDAVGLTLYSDRVIEHAPAKSRPDQLQTILQLLATTPPSGPSRAGYAFEGASHLYRGRGILVVIGDLYDDLPGLARGIDHLRCRQHEMIVFQIMDPWERHLPDEGTLCFRDLETGEEIIADPTLLGNDYRRAFEAWESEVEEVCRQRAVERIAVTTNEPIQDALLRFLEFRRAQRG